ncbi:MAG: peptide ABC transporter substrate-binding protein [Anaerolineae bacterium]
MIITKRTLCLGLLLAALLSVAACWRSRPDAELAQTIPPIVQTVIVRETVVVERIVEVTPTPDPSLQPVTLRLNLEGEPTSIDPALVDDPGALDLVANLFLGLTRVDDQGEVLPALASAWSVSQDGLRWIFDLAAGASWVSYRPGSGAVALDAVSADDVVYAVRRACDPRTGAVRVELNYIIAGCQALHTADLATLSAEEIQTLIDAVGVLALNDATVQVTLVEPAGHLPALMAMPINRPLHRPTLEQHGPTWTEPGNIVSNGPYLLTGWFHGDSMALARNPRWPGWQEATGNVRRVEFSMAPAAQALEAYRAGELDSMAAPRELLTTIAADQRLSAELVTIPTSCSEYYGFGASQPPLDNALVRRALSAAIDRQALAQGASGGGLPANTFAPAMVWGSAAGDATIAPWALTEEQGGWGYAQALTQAQAWLAEAGYAGGEGLPALTLLHNAADGPAQTAQAVAAMWRDGLGVEVVVRSLPWPEYWQLLGVLGGDVQTGPSGEELPQVWRMGYCGDLADQDNWLGAEFSTERGADRLRWAGSANAPLAADGRSFNQLMAAGRQSSDPVERQALYREAERILNDTAAAMAPLYYYEEAFVTRPNVQRTYDALNGHWFAAWRVD